VAGLVRLNPITITEQRSFLEKWERGCGRHSDFRLVTRTPLLSQTAAGAVPGHNLRRTSPERARPYANSTQADTRRCTRAFRHACSSCNVPGRLGRTGRECPTAAATRRRRP
jgi:hypothetical protein